MSIDVASPCCRKLTFPWLSSITTGSVHLIRLVASFWGATQPAPNSVIGPTCWRPLGGLSLNGIPSRTPKRQTKKNKSPTECRSFRQSLNYPLEFFYSLFLYLNCSQSHVFWWSVQVFWNACYFDKRLRFNFWSNLAWLCCSMGFVLFVNFSSLAFFVDLHDVF